MTFFLVPALMALKPLFLPLVQYLLFFTAAWLMARAVYGSETPQDMTTQDMLRIKDQFGVPGPDSASSFETAPSEVLEAVEAQPAPYTPLEDATGSEAFVGDETASEQAPEEDEEYLEGFRAAIVEMSG